jgi:hypothetical protein
MTTSSKSHPVTVAGPPVRRVSRLWLVALGVALLVQLVVLYAPQGVGGPQITGLDKVVHLSIFAAPVLAALMAGLSAPWVVGILAVHGPVSELIQYSLLSHRSGDVFDALADVVGVVIGAMVYVVWRRRQS